MFVVDEHKGGLKSLPAKDLSIGYVKALSSTLAGKILKSIVDKGKYPAQIAKELRVHEQKVYYHIRNLQKAGIVVVEREENKQGATARYYKCAEPSFVIRLKEFEHTHKISHLNEQTKRFLEPFIVDGKLNATIIVGSPDPHGPDKARSRDGYYGMDLALFLGTFLNYVPTFNVKLDTETREEDLKNNLILIGGPVVNKITERFNKDLPVNFNEENNIVSSISKQVYPSDDTGIIVKVKNSFDSDKCVLVVAGKRYSGTRAAIIAFLKQFGEITMGNMYKRSILAKVVEGIDLDSDGIIDDIEFRE
ncbi:S-layer protein [Candidatus Woesearchaeota archaeon]|nr:S-layer protein [Candidatus Woesearchaeota archaeon]